MDLERTIREQEVLRFASREYIVGGNCNRVDVFVWCEYLVELSARVFSVIVEVAMLS